VFTSGAIALGVNAFVGAAFDGANTGRMIGGIIIDNPSGAWLSVGVGGATWYVAPYTLRWIKRIDPVALSIDTVTMLAAGPSGQVSTVAGGPIVLTILDSPPDTADTSYLAGFTPVLIAVNATQVVRWSTGYSEELIPATAGKRIRLLTLSVRNGYSDVAALYPVCGISYVVQPLASGTALIGRVSPDKPESVQSFPSGVDFPPGVAVWWSAQADWADQLIAISATYQVI